jgi:hypothetical protein
MANGNQRKFVPQTGGGLQIGGFKPIPRPQQQQPPQFFTGGSQNFNEVTGQPRMSSGLQINAPQQQQQRPTRDIKFNNPQGPTTQNAQTGGFFNAPGSGGDPTTGTPAGGLLPEDFFDISLGSGGFAGFDPKKFSSAFGEGFQPGTAPTFNELDFQDSGARQQFQDIFNRSTGGSIQSFDRAQNRLRERTRQASDVGRQQAIEQGLGGGRGAFQGALQNRLGQIESGRLGALSEGQVGLESQFEDARLRGLQTALGASQGLGGLDTAFNQLGLQQSLAGNEFARDIFQGQEELGQREASDLRGTITDRTLGQLDQITKRGGIRAGILQALGGIL